MSRFTLDEIRAMDTARLELIRDNTKGKPDMVWLHEGMVLPELSRRRRRDPDAETYVESTVIALGLLGGTGSRLAVINLVRELREKEGLNIPRFFENVVQANMERKCRDSEVFDGDCDALFYWPEGQHAGMWALTDKGRVEFHKLMGREVVPCPAS